MQILEHGQEQEQTLLFFPCTAEPVWAFPPERFTLPGHDPVKEYDTMEVYLKTYSDRTIHNVFCRATITPCRSRVILWLSPPARCRGTTKKRRGCKR